MEHKYFTVEEMIKSSTAVKLGINNKPTKEILSHLNELMDVLDIIREAWGSAIIVTSGFRCEELNKAVGGSKTSVHKTGYAVDMKPKNGKTREFFQFILNFLKSNGMLWDQLIDEYNYSWVHLGIRSNNGSQRKQILHIK